MAVKRRYTVIIDEEDGHVGALAPDGIALGLGDTVDEAREDLRAGIAAVIASYIEAGKPTAQPSGCPTPPAPGGHQAVALQAFADCGKSPFRWQLAAPGGPWAGRA